MPRLVVHIPEEEPRVIELPSDRAFFARMGRDAHCEIVLKHSSVSGEHCLLRSGDGGYLIEDLGSTNGVRINGETPMGEAMLYDGDKVRLGGVLLEFEETALKAATAVGDEEDLQALADAIRGQVRCKRVLAVLYAVGMFVLAVLIGMAYRHYRETGQWLPPFFGGEPSSEDESALPRL